MKTRQIGNEIIFYGGVGSTTGANFMFTNGKVKVLIDCGLRQGSKKEEEENFLDFSYDPSEVDFLLITHAHMDHIGRVPKLIRDGFRGKIVSTAATKQLSELALQDALRVISSKYPDRVLFESEDVEVALRIWETKEYHEVFELGEGLKCEFYNSGHILGSSIVVIEDKSGRVAFTGDLGNSPSLLLQDVELPQNIDYLVIESVYGDRNHDNKAERHGKMQNLIREGIRRGGAILIPVFSIERAQVLLYEINNMIEDGEIDQVPVYLDSPLGAKVTEVYRNYKELFNKNIKAEISGGDDIFDFPNFKIIDSLQDSSLIHKEKGPKIILAGSGMSEGGRMISHEQFYLEDPNSTLIFVGYQAVATLGRRLEQGEKRIEIYNKNKEGKKEKKIINVRAHIEKINGYSSHMDMDHLTEFVDNLNAQHKLRKVFVCMGEPKSSLHLVQRLRDYVGVEAVYPEINREYIV